MPTPAEDLRRERDLIKAAERGQTPSEIFWAGGNSVSGSGGDASIAVPLNNGPRPQGAPAFLVPGGLAQTDGLSRTKQRQQTPIFSKKGEVVVLATKVVGANTEVYLGGDRPVTLITAIPSSTINHISLELTGPAKSDWIVAIRYSNTIQMLFGSHTETTPLNWTLTDPRCSILNYGGMGFWRSSSPFKPQVDQFSTTEQVLAPDATTLRNQLNLIQTGEHSRIEDATTIAYEYFENSELPTPSTLSSSGYTRRLGIQQIVGVPFVFRGTNTTESVNAAVAAFEGPAQGPGYLGPGGATVDPATPSISAIEILPRKIGNDSNTQSRIVETQTVSFSAFEGAIAQSIGELRVTGSANATTQLRNFPTPRETGYLGSARPFGTIGLYLWTIYYTSNIFWPSEPLSITTTDNGLAISSSNSLAIAPGVTKNYSLSATSAYLTTANGNAVLDTPSPGLAFGGGFTWSNFSRSGSARLDPLSGDIFTWNSGSTFEEKHWLNWNGIDVEAQVPLGYIGRTWQIDPTNTEFPKSNEAIVLDPQKLFQNSGTQKAEITPYTGAIVGGKLVYQEDDKFQKKVLSLSKLGNTAQLRMAKYWDS